MQKVITINLNGHAYQLDESGYDTLRAYLERAEDQLKDNPDRAEIVADLEQAIADKCRKYLGPHKTVVTGSEIDQIVAEMGPVDGTAGEDATGTESSAGTGKDDEARSKRLYRIMDGAMVAGVCNGLAAYLQVDVTIVRVIFALMVVLTKGTGILVYLVMMFVIPEAKTPEERAVASGAPFNAKDVIDRARKIAEGSKQQLRRQQRMWRRQGWPPGVPLAYGPPPFVLLLPLFGLVHIGLFLLMLAMLISLVNTGEILNWQLPPDVPVWAGALILLIAYQIIVSPIRLARHWTWYPRPGVEPGVFAFWNAVTMLVGLTVAIWIASNHIPEIREFLQRLPDLFRDFTHAVREAVKR